ncbi:predicted protein [Histoplasma mississippiense (nom. inval.)]|nr:predicted protein [Histoplasma mississippiense (nom. inval.)]EDN05818.1 predicted protein [Histoplasma mississippiense (nom. inval.)]
MLESHHELVVKALQQLYTHCVNNECFPGDPIDLVDGNPCTHAILDRLGLIKQAEEAREKVEEESSSQALCWKSLPKSSGSAVTDALSPEPVSSLELSPSSKSVSISPPELECAKSDPSTRGQNVPCPFYHGSAAVWPFQAPDVEFNHSYSSTFGTEAERIIIEPSGIQTYLSIETANSFTPTGACTMGSTIPAIYSRSIHGSLEIGIDDRILANVIWDCPKGIIKILSGIRAEHRAAKRGKTPEAF